MKPFEGVPGRFTGLPDRLRNIANLLANPSVISKGQWCYVTAALEDAALKIEALERETISKTATPS